MSGASGAGPAVYTRDPNAAFEVAVALEEAGRLADAENIYRQLLAAFPGKAPVLHNLALIQRRQGQLGEASANLRRAIDADPSKPAYHNSLGTVRRAEGFWAEAEECYRRALALWPDYPEAHFNLGLLLELLGRVPEAVDEFREALRAKPDYGPAAARLCALLQSASPEEALQVLEAAAAGRPAPFEIEYYRGTTLSMLKRHDEALGALGRATALKPDSLEAALATASALREAGRLDEAVAAYWRAMELRPDRLATHEELNRLAWMASRSDVYLRSFQYVKDKRGPDPELLQLEAAFRLRGEQHDQAEALLRQAREMAPGRDGEAAGLLARAVAGQGRFEESYPLFIEAIRTDPSVIRHRQEFGLALLRDRQAAQARQVFEEALRVSPFDQIVLAGLALAYRALQDSRYHALVDFSRYVRVYELEAPRGLGDVGRFNRLLAEELQQLHVWRAEPIEQTVRGGTQSTGRLFDERLPMVQQLRDRIEAAVQDYMKQVQPNDWHPVALRKPSDVRFAGSWSCWLRSGGFHSNHVHPQGWLSSAYYVRLPDAARDAARKEGWLKFGQSNLGLGANDVADQELQPAVGRLVLFPSYFWHGTVPFSDRGDRLAVAFDVAPGAGSLPVPAGDEVSPATVAP